MTRPHPDTLEREKERRTTTARMHRVYVTVSKH